MRDQLKLNLLEVTTQKILGSYDILKKWDSAIQNKVGFKWHPYIARCQVEISSKPPNGLIERSIEPIVRYVPNLRVKLQNDSLTLEEFFGGSATEIACICKENLSVTPSWNEWIELVHSALESTNMKIPAEAEIAANRNRIS